MSLVYTTCTRKQKLFSVAAVDGDIAAVYG